MMLQLRKMQTKRSDRAPDGSPYLYMFGGDSLNPVCWVPEASQQGNCILIQSTPLCVSVIQQTIVSGICIRAMKFSPLAFAVQRDETTVGVLAYLLPCYGKITFTRRLQSCTTAFLLKCIARKKFVCFTREPIYFLLVCKFDTMWLLRSRGQEIRVGVAAAACRDNLMDTIRQRWLWGSRC